MRRCSSCGFPLTDENHRSVSSSVDIDHYIEYWQCDNCDNIHMIEPGTHYVSDSSDKIIKRELVTMVTSAPPSAEDERFRKSRRARDGTRSRRRLLQDDHTTYTRNSDDNSQDTATSPPAHLTFSSDGNLSPQLNLSAITDEGLKERRRKIQHSRCSCGMSCNFRL